MERLCEPRRDLKLMNLDFHHARAWWKPGFIPFPGRRERPKPEPCVCSPLVLRMADNPVVRDRRQVDGFSAF